MESWTNPSFSYKLFSILKHHLLSRNDFTSLGLYSFIKALNSLKKLKYCEAHATYIVTNGDKKTLKSLQINLTCEPKYIDEI